MSLYVLSSKSFVLLLGILDARILVMHVLGKLENLYLKIKYREKALRFK